MKVRKTNLEGCLVIEPDKFTDNRGYFFESFNQKKFDEATGEKIDFVQDNQSRSRYGVLRGLHYQNAPHAQSKLVRVLSGKILDVVVDIRKDSQTFSQAFCLELSGDNNLQIFVPKGFAHGFITLSDSVEMVYKCDRYYHPKSEGGIYYDSPEFKIDWKVPKKDIILSEKDKGLPKLIEAVYQF